MAVKTKSIDRNRFKKTYPRFRPLPNPGFQADGPVVVEGLVVAFNDESSKFVTLEGRYTTVPTVTLTPLGDINNVNLFVTSVNLASVPSAGGRTVTVGVESSAPFTGYVQLQALQT